MNTKLVPVLFALVLLGVLLGFSATVTAENHNSLTVDDQGLENGEVTVEDVSTAQESTIVVTYDDRGEAVIAGLTDADNLNGKTVQVEIEDDGGFPGEHNVWLFNDTDVPDGIGIGDDATPITSSALAADSALVSVDVTGDGPARDSTGDGLLNDANGDGEFTIFDVQALFDNLQSDPVQANPGLFDFDDNGDNEVNIFDVQGLFTRLQTPSASLNISEQATASSTFTAAEPTTPGVLVTDVGSNVDSTVLVTYQQGDEVVVAGLETFEQPELAGDDVVVPVEDTGGFPGEHTAHVIPTDELSSQYEPGDTVSGATAAAVLDSETATVFQGTVELANQTVVGAVGDGDLTVDASLAGDDSALYAINLHNSTDAGAPGSFVGATDVISGAAGSVELRLEDPSGKNVTIEETGEFIAMIHIVDDDSVEEGDSFPPAAFPVLPHTDATGPVPGGVTDDAAVTVLEPANFSVSIDPPGTLVEGETLSVETTITNTGDVEATQNITLDVGSLGTNATNVTLSSGESQDVTLSVGTQSGDADEYTATVSSANDTASANVTVLAPAEFSVDITETNTPVEGEQLNVTAQVENVGDVEAEQTIDLEVGPLGTNSTNVTLSGGTSTNATLSVGTEPGDAGEFTATASSANDTTSANVTVLASAEFLVDITETNTPVEGEQLNVTAQVQNVGDVEAERTITLDVSPLGTNSTNVTLSGGASTNATLSVGTGTGDAGQYNATVSSVDDSANANVTVLAPGSFSVEITGKNTPVEGEQLNVTTTVENTGDTEDTQNITLSVDPLGTNSTNVTLSGGESQNLTLSVGTADSAGKYTATVSSVDDTASANVTVLASAEFSIDITETNTPVEGEQLSVTAQVENVGDVEAEQTIDLDVGPLGTNSTNVTLSGGASTSVTLSVGTGTDDAGQYNATVSSANDSAGANVTVLAPTDFRVAIVEADNVTEGEQLDVLTEVQNTGDVEAEQTISLDVGPLGTNSTNVTLSGGESQNLTLSVGTADSAGEYTATVSSADDTASANVTVLAPAEFLVDITETNTPVEGERLNVTAQVENVGDVEAEQTISLDVDPLGTNSTNVTLSGGESQNLTLSVGTADSAGKYTATVSSVDDTASANVTVLASAEFSIDITETNTPVEGEQLSVTAQVENVGDVEAEQTIDLDVDPLGTNSTNVTLSGGASTSVTLSVGTGTDDAGQYTVIVSSANDSASESVTVLAPAELTVDIVEASNVTEGEQLDVVTEVENAGDVGAEQTIDLDVGPLGTDSTTVQLGGGASTQVTLSVGTSSGDADEYTAVVSSADDSTTANVTVLEPAFFEVSTLDPENATVDEREAFDVSATVENTGDVGDTQTVELLREPGGAEITNQTLNLAGGSSKTVTFENVTVEDPGEYNHTVVTENDQVSGNLTVKDLPAGNFSVDFVGQTNETVAGEQQTFDVRVNNTGTERALQEIKFDWGTGTHTASEFVALNASESTVTTLTVQTDSDEFLGQYNVTASSLNETDTTRARINPERIIENAEVAPGGTVDVTVTGELGGNLNFTLIESYQPAVNSSKLNSASFAPRLTIFDSDLGLATFEEKGPGTLNIAYEIVLPSSASSGDEFGYDEQDTTFELGGVPFDIGGDDTITVDSDASVGSMSFAPV